MGIELKSVKDQVIVITGASSGIGLATAITAAQRGAKVVLSARSDETLDEVVAKITAAGGDAIAVHADVGRRAEVQTLAEHAIARYGRIDTWVNNAGVSIYGRLDEVPEEAARRLFDTNYWGVVHGSLVALPFLKQAGGALINVGSEVSEAAVPLQGHYTASKHAVKGFTDALRVEIEEVDGAPVAITLVQPTATDTPFPENARNYMDKEAKLPSPQIDPQQVAEAILDAAKHHRRAVKVGAMSKVNTAVAKLAPSIGDKMAASYVDKQKGDGPPKDPDGALERAGHSGRIRGSGARERSHDGPPSHR